MIGAGPDPDPLAAATVAAARAARRARLSLHEEVIPALPPQARVFAAHVLRHVERDRFLDRDALHDIAAFLDVLRRAIADGTHLGWEADGQHVRGGWETRHLDERAAALLRPARDLERLHAAIADVLDVARASRLAEALMET